MTLTQHDRAVWTDSMVREIEDEPPPPCEAHPTLPEHPGHWYAVCPCGHPVIVVCHDRHRQAFAQGGWRCSTRAKGCSTFHPFEELGFTRIRP